MTQKPNERKIDPEYVGDLLRSDPEFLEQVGKLLDKRKVAAPPSVQLYPKYVLMEGHRKIGTHVVVSNGFERRSGTLVSAVNEEAWICRVDGVEIVAHEPHCAWVSNTEV